MQLRAGPPRIERSIELPTPVRGVEVPPRAGWNTDQETSRSEEAALAYGPPRGRRASRFAAALAAAFLVMLLVSVAVLYTLESSSESPPSATPTTPPATSQVVVPSVTGIELQEARQLILSASLVVGRTAGSGRVVSQTPPSGTLVPASTPVDLLLAENLPPRAVQVPDLVGLTVDQARQLLASVGLLLEAQLDGDSVIIGQDPPPDALVDTRSSVVVEVRAGVEVRSGAAPSWFVPAAGAALAALACVAAALVLSRRRHRGRRVTPEPALDRRPGDKAMRPHASLGTPDVLVLTAATTEGDPRLREHLAQESQAAFVSLQLACSFDPTSEWEFIRAKFTVRLVRGDGLPAPAPFAYSLRPLSERDGSARERTAELGADAKFVSAKVGQTRTSPGDLVVRGYGLQQSVSYWQFTPTKADPLRGSYWLWLIVKAPKETDLAVTSSLEVEVLPTQWWPTAERPSVEGVGEVGVTVHLADGEPYRVEELSV